MNFVSTRSPVESISFSEAIFRGLAPDGGLYQFETNPYFPNFFASLHQDISFNALSTALSYELLNSEYDKKTIAGIVNDAFDFAPTLHRLDDSTTVLELFHGPSCAFKDYGASFLASVMTRLLRARNEKIIIVTATSGDTGSAVAQAFHDREGIDVVILYPSSRVSPLQEKQLTTLG
ncbi:MAG: threonine synthase, partial [spirochete symbiont of Stewartia floridana]